MKNRTVWLKIHRYSQDLNLADYGLTCTGISYSVISAHEIFDESKFCLFMLKFPHMIHEIQ